MNTMAVSLLQQRNDNEANDLIGAGLESLLSIVRSADDISITPTCAQTELSASIVLPVPLPKLTREEMAISPEGSFAIFNSVFLLPCDRRLSIDYCSATLLYNMSLIHHRHGIEACASGSLRRALHMYEMACRTLSQAPERETPSGCLLMMALLNNLGQLHSVLFNRREAKEYRQELVKSVVGSTSTSSSTTECDYASLFFDSLFVHATELSCAPAA